MVSNLSARYGAMILEALSELNEPNGTELTEICSFIEVDTKSYRLADSFATRTPAPIKASAPKQKDPSKPSKVSKNLGLFATSSPALEAAMAAAAKVADAEVKAHDAHDQMMEAERILKMAEKTESLLTIAAEIYDRCSRGEITTLNPAQREV